MELFIVWSVRTVTSVTSGNLLGLWANTTTTSSPTLAVSEHLKIAKHPFDPDKVKILAREPKDFCQKNLGDHSHQKGEAHHQQREGVGLWVPVLIN